VPRERGHDALGILRAAAAGDVDVLVLLGADPLADVPDRDLATRALGAVRTVIALDQLPSASTEMAHIVFPVAGFTEVDGTSTNIEGRISRQNRKVTPPGTAQPDWIVAADLAVALGADLGLGSVEAIRDEIDRLAPAYRGFGAALAGPGASDGVVVPVDGGAGAEALVSFDAPGAAAELPALDRYSLRLVVTRRLYDEGVHVRRSPSLAGLAPGTGLRVNPYDFDRLGVADGAEVRLRSSRADLRVAVTADAGVPRGTAAVYYNQPGLDAAALIDADERVTTVRVETGGA